jgi:alcohol dehydrogenase class IV
LPPDRPDGYDAGGMGTFPELRPGSELDLRRGSGIGEFQFPRLERVTSGPHVIDSLPTELDRRHLTRAVVVTGRTLGASSLLRRITGPLGERCVLVFAQARQHVPSCSVAELARAIDQHHADCVISFGGGSPIDTVKAAIHTLVTAAGQTSSTDEGPVHIAISTTLSAGEFTAVLGITDEQSRVKRAVSDPRLVPRTVYMDPTVTLETPAWLWAASGVRALDHAVETMYSARPHPLSDALAARGLRLLLEHLPASLSTTGAEQWEHRQQCQMGAWLSVFGMTNAGLGLSHALGHQIGPRWDVPHGVTSCITLPHAMRLMATVAPERFGPIAQGFGIPFEAADVRPAALECADRMARFIAQFELPQRLRDVQVPRQEIPEVADLVHDILESAHVGDRPISREQVESVLTGAY